MGIQYPLCHFYTYSLPRVISTAWQQHCLIFIAECYKSGGSISAIIPSGLKFYLQFFTITESYSARRSYQTGAQGWLAKLTFLSVNTAPLAICAFPFLLTKWRADSVDCFSSANEQNFKEFIWNTCFDSVISFGGIKYLLKLPSYLH